MNKCQQVNTHLWFKIIIIFKSIKMILLCHVWHEPYKEFDISRKNIPQLDRDFFRVSAKTLTLNSSMGRFHRCSTYSFYAHRSQKRKKILMTWLSSYAFRISTSVKVVCRTLVKSTPCVSSRRLRYIVSEMMILSKGESCGLVLKYSTHDRKVVGLIPVQC